MIFPFFLCLSLLLPAQRPQPFRFEAKGISPAELAERAIAAHPTVQAARERIREAEGLRRQAAFRPNPVLTTDGSSTRFLGQEDEGERSAGISQTFELGGKRQRRVEVSDLGAQIAVAAAADAERRLRAEITTAYVEAVSSHRQLMVLDEQLQVAREFLRLTELRAREGEIAPLEADLTRVETARLEAQRVLAQAALDRSLAALERLVPRGLLPLALRDRLETGTLLVSESDLRDRALTERPDLRIARLRAQQANAQVRLAQAQGIPDLAGSVRYIREVSAFENVLGTGRGIRSTDNLLAFGLSIPLPFRNRNQGNIEAAAAAEQASRLDISALEAEVVRDVITAHAGFQAARTAGGILRREVVEQAERNLGVIREAYRLGQLRLLDVLNEQRRTLELRLGAIEVERELARSAAALEAAVGRSLGLLP